MKLTEAIETGKPEKPHSFSMDHCTLFVTEVEQAVQEYLGIPVSERRESRREEDERKGTDRSGAVQRALYIISESGR